MNKVRRDNIRKIKILIADDHEVVRKGLRTLFELEEEFKIVGEAGSGYEAIEKAKKVRPDIILMDFRMPEMDGVVAALEIKAVLPKTKIVLLTAFGNEKSIFEAIKEGIDGCLLKDACSADLLKGVRLVNQGEVFVEPALAQKIFKKLSVFSKSGQRQQIPDKLTSRELQVLELMAQGFKNQEIDKELWVTEATVKTHVSSVLRKLNQADRTKAVLYAIRQGLVKMPDSQVGKSVV